MQRHRHDGSFKVTICSDQVIDPGDMQNLPLAIQLGAGKLEHPLLRLAAGEDTLQHHGPVVLSVDNRGRRRLRVHPSRQSVFVAGRVRPRQEQRRACGLQAPARLDTVGRLDARPRLSQRGLRVADMRPDRDEVAALVAFLASEEAPFMCGSLVEITGAQAVA